MVIQGSPCSAHLGLSRTSKHLRPALAPNCKLFCAEASAGFSLPCKHNLLLVLFQAIKDCFRRRKWLVSYFFLLGGKIGLLGPKTGPRGKIMWQTASPDASGEGHMQFGIGAIRGIQPSMVSRRENNPQSLANCLPLFWMLEDFSLRMFSTMTVMVTLSHSHSGAFSKYWHICGQRWYMLDFPRTFDQVLHYKF